MILVTLGTQKQDFTRLLDIVSKIKTNERIVVQSGHTKYESNKMEIIPFMSYDEMEELIDGADLIITHGGTGSIITPLKKGKKVIACSRLSKFNEHVDNHQQELVNHFENAGYILKIEEKTDINKLVKKAKKTKFKDFKSNNNSFINNLRTEINTKKKKINPNDLFLIISVLFIFSFIALAFFTNETDVMVLENRNAYKFSTVDDLIESGETYQRAIELTLADQFILSNKLKMGKNIIDNFVFSSSVNTLLNITNENLLYIPMNNSLFKLGDSNYLVYENFTFEAVKDQLDNGIEKYNNIIKSNEDINFNFYYIDRDRSYDFDDPSISTNIYSYIVDGLDTLNVDSLLIESIDDYKNYFYETDHHWNSEGSYLGYLHMMKLLNISDGLLKVEEETCIQDINFLGSKSRKATLISYNNDFCVKTFDYPEFKIIINGTEKNYGDEEEYIALEYSDYIYENHYAQYYGSDYGEIIFEVEDNIGKENILILGDSYTNSVNKLIASHYSKTFVIDERYYESFKGEAFNISEYCSKNNISTVLYITSIGNF